VIFAAFQLQQWLQILDVTLYVRCAFGVNSLEKVLECLSVKVVVLAKGGGARKRWWCSQKVVVLAKAFLVRNTNFRYF